MSADDPNANRPGYKETKVGWIPEEWECVQIGEISKKFQAGVSVNSTDRSAREDEIGVLKTSCVSTGIFRPSENKSVLPEEVHRVAVPVTKGSVVISRMNTSKLVGANSFIPADYPNLFLPDRLWKTSVQDPEIDHPRWFGYAMESSPTRFRISALATGTSGSMKNVAQSDVRSIPLARPPFSQQIEIAEILSTCEEVIEKTGELIEAKKWQKRALMQQLLTGRKRLPGFAKTDEKSETRTGEIPADWKSVPLAHVFEKRVERSGDELPLMAVTIESGLVSRDSVERKVDSELSASDNLVARQGDIAYNTMRMWQGAVGVAEQDCHVSPAYVVCSPREGVADSKFFYYWFKSAEGLHLLWSYSYGITGDRLRLYADDFAKVPAPLPSLEEQRVIVSVIEAAEDEIASLRQKRGALLRQRKALMQKLLTGQVRVTV